MKEEDRNYPNSILKRSAKGCSSKLSLLLHYK